MFGGKLEVQKRNLEKLISETFRVIGYVDENSPRNICKCTLKELAKRT